MRPVLFQFGGLPVYSYSAFIVFGYIACLAYGIWQAKKQGQDQINVIDLSVFIFVGGFIGARILYVIVSWQTFAAAPVEILKIWNGGFVYFGGFFGGIAGAFIIILWRRLDFWLWVDMATPTGMLSLAFGRVGCFLNGCCYGTFCSPNLPWGFIYPMSHPGLGLAQIPVHPTPLYESIACIAITLFLIWRMPRKRFPGEIFGLMALLYSVIRFALEYLRADPRGSIPALGLSTSQAISVVTFVAAVIFLVMKWKQSQRLEASVGVASGSKLPEDPAGREAPPP